MKWNDATEYVLREEGHAIHFEDLATTIVKRGLVESSSKYPGETLRIGVLREKRARRDSGALLRLDIQDKLVHLYEWMIHEVQRDLEEKLGKLADKAKAELLRKLQGLSGDKFESYVESLLIQMDYENVALRGGSRDEGVDLLCEMTVGINQIKTAVQAKCKQPRNRIGYKEVRYLRDVLLKFKCSQGVLITTSGFTKDAEEVANEEGRLPIILIDGRRLAELALKHEVGVKGLELPNAYVLDDHFDLWSPA